MSSHYSSSTSSLSSGADINLLPKHRIKCLTDQIKVGSQNFQSATDALTTYLQQFEELSINGNLKKLDNFLTSPLLEAYLAEKRPIKKDSLTLTGAGQKCNHSKAIEDVESLLTSKVEKPLKDELSDSEYQSRLAQLLQQSSSQKQPKTGLQEEVEAALLRSAKLLEKVGQDNKQSPQTTASSEISNVSTELLLANSSFYQSNNLELPENHNKHNYSYHVKKSQPRLLSTNTHAPISYTNLYRSRERKKRSSIGALLSSLQRSNSLSSALSKQQNKTISEGSLRCRSASPAPTRETITLHKSIVPSWIKEENTSDISDSIWQPKVDGMLNFPSSYSLHSVPSVGLKSQLNADSQTGIQLTDLATSTVYTPSLDTSSLGIDGLHHRPITKEPQKHSTPLTYLNNRSTTKHLLQSKNLSNDLQTEEFLNSVTLPQTAKLKQSLEDLTFSSENYQCHRPVSPSSSDSSLDTLSLLAGRTKPTVSSAINGASGGGPGVTFSPDYESEGLDGDRSWEKVTNYKAPVHIENIETENSALSTNGQMAHENFQGTFSGRKQPGSMEALKNMLFKLQAEEKSTRSQHTKAEERCEVESQNLTDNEVNLPALQDYDFSQEPGGHSLEQALIHLNRLKELVKSTQVATGSALKI
ncbi:uncharacterized protein LOC106078520 [Biomphalaria glabrata]|uniref:Uncharacterized protein LOC106078520 n=1 Tax=Biomphalaria glabrata TaxID=6526 RepID=A0A9W2ZRZ0_BIOGL|nr:uncharacterized protein LOC106078520 [Biomphalaria glabrata]XP_013094864.2 uncharacterized protein LOC106078520 [Biomphalaria glabrata]XP_013094865.2 uncharacterized protein LOC106078520 [Biomphalaria glabrata]XP_055877759.1 uncharacterized protein LOC106078520 [Biomphalaria glabrata]XP_055877767.1 uncharacterized protein LOC106078520 [Biomphalaria glabrata]XP_055877776.1 uncharacterized protein LOC106078520 [Biomphalaria glabrata]XP_055877782.1 uncharacterized protein LOC106078520 [Biomph